MEIWAADYKGFKIVSEKYGDNSADFYAVDSNDQRVTMVHHIDSGLFISLVRKLGPKEANIMMIDTVKEDIDQQNFVNS